MTEAVEVDTTSEARSEETEAAETDGGNEEAAATEETSVATDVTEAAEVEQAAEGEEADVAEEAEVTEEAETLENGKTLKSKTAKNKRNKRARRPRTKPLIGKRTAVGIVVAASLLFVGSAGFAGAATQRYLSERAVIATKLNVARTAANAITTLWSYTPENMDTLADRAANYLSGDFAAQYRKFVDAITAPNKQAKISSNTLVTGAAVETLDGPNAIAIVYTNTTSSSALKKNIPSLKYLSYRVNLKHDHGRWLVTRMTTVTQLDITPRI
ncbi:mammalian cell entry protein [Mycobacterium sp.]|uniref:mammalian cell entry protein n=1 Tax=Mycobacterium sp. TaxID=1785 RepID=UPI0039C9E598